MTAPESSLNASLFCQLVAAKALSEPMNIAFFADLWECILEKSVCRPLLCPKIDIRGQWLSWKWTRLILRYSQRPLRLELYDDMGENGSTLPNFIVFGLWNIAPTAFAAD
jgi:hypothetical protein